MSEKIYAIDMLGGMTYIGKCNNDEVNKVKIRDFIMVPTIDLIQDKRAYNLVALERYDQKNRSKETDINLENLIAFTEITKK